MSNTTQPELSITFLDLHQNQIGEIQKTNRPRRPEEARFMRVEATREDKTVVVEHMFGTRRELLYVVRGIIQEPKSQDAINFMDRLKKAERELALSNHEGLFDMNLVTLEIKKISTQTAGSTAMSLSTIGSSLFGVPIAHDDDNDEERTNFLDRGMLMGSNG